MIQQTVYIVTARVCAHKNKTVGVFKNYECALIGLINHLASHGIDGYNEYISLYDTIKSYKDEYNLYYTNDGNIESNNPYDFYSEEFDDYNEALNQIRDLKNINELFIDEKYTRHDFMQYICSKVKTVDDYINIMCDILIVDDFQYTTFSINKHIVQ